MGTYGQNHAHNFNAFASMSYVTGSHTFKAGALFLNMAAHTTREITGNGTALQLLDGVPVSVVVYATPFAIDEKLKMQLGLLRAGPLEGQSRDDLHGPALRQLQRLHPRAVDRSGPLDAHPRHDVRGSTQHAELEGPLAPLRRFLRPVRHGQDGAEGDDQPLPVRTRSRRVHAPRQPDRRHRPRARTRNWTDVNGDFVPQETELGPLSARDFGSPIINTRYDTDVLEGWGKRGDNWEVSGGIQHELMPRVGVSARATSAAGGATCT